MNEEKIKEQEASPEKNVNAAPEPEPEVTEEKESDDNKSYQPIRKWDIFRVFLRSFFLQSVWNYRTLISVGFGVCLIPILKRLYNDPQSQKAFLSRHLKFFNAHPYMASYALGVSIHLEEAFARGKADACDQLERMKELLITILGAIGDTLFWSTIKPASLIVGTFALAISTTTPQRLGALAITFFMYNIPHIHLRFKGIWEGYRYGLNVYKYIDKNRFKKLQNGYFFTGLIAFLLFFAFLIRTLIQENPYYLLMLALSIATYVSAFRFTKKFYLSIYLTLLVGIFSGIIYQIFA